MSSLNPNPDPTDLDTILKEIEPVPAHKVLAYSLFEQARQAAALGRELEATGSCDPNDLRLLTRRAAANQQAARLLFPLEGGPEEARARELLGNLWQAKGTVVQ
ncbi:MAG: hypothetical protein SFU83_23580 [Meiothermus sp.]|nr:hypothetical protein [Meiothermus sp.]